MKVAVIVLADPTTSPRPARLIEQLREDGHEVLTIGTRNSDRNLNMKRKRRHYIANVARYLLRRYETLAHSFIPTGLDEYLREQAPDVVVLHDVRLMPWLAQVKGSWRLIVDLQEYYPGMLDSLTWRLSMGALYRHILAEYGQADAYWTVSRSLQDYYQERHGIKADLVPNASRYKDLKPSPVGSPMQCVHHGYALPDRNLEAMVEAVESCKGRLELDLILLGEPAWEAYHRRLLKSIDSCKYVHLVEPGPQSRIIEDKNRYDIGLYPLGAPNENMRGAMPNKFYDFLQARLCLVTGPEGEMAETVTRLGIGYNTRGLKAKDIRKSLLSLTRRGVEASKANSHARAYDYSWQRQCAPVIRRTLEELN